MDVKPYIDYLVRMKIGEKEALEYLKNDKNLSPDEKNLIFAYCYPRQLRDRELPERMKGYRLLHPGTSLICPGETTLILEAGRTQQYERFIKHLMHAFGDPEKVFPVSGIERDECSICGEVLLEKDLWENEGGGDEEKLSYGSTESAVILCKKCLLNLIQAKNIINTLDPSYLDWKKRWDVLNPLKRAF